MKLSWKNSSIRLTQFGKDLGFLVFPVFPWCKTCEETEVRGQGRDFFDTRMRKIFFIEKGTWRGRRDVIYLAEQGEMDRLETLGWILWQNTNCNLFLKKEKAAAAADFLCQFWRFTTKASTVSCNMWPTIYHFQFHQPTIYYFQFHQPTSSQALKLRWSETSETTMFQHPPCHWRGWSGELLV